MCHEILSNWYWAVFCFQTCGYIVAIGKDLIHLKHHSLVAETKERSVKADESASQ
jgi:hypothetical protein